MSLSPIALEALRAAQAAFSATEADVFEDALARGLEAVDREGRLVGAYAAAKLDRLEALVNAQPAALSEAQVEALAAAGNRAVNDAIHADLCACDAWPEKCLSSGGFYQGYWDMGGLETAVPAVVGLWESMRADTAAGELGRLRARIAELEAERHSTNEALADVTVALCSEAVRSRPLPSREARCGCGHVGAMHHHAGTGCWAYLPREVGDPVRVCPCTAFVPVSVEESADKLTQLLAPSQALREEEAGEVFVPRTERSYWVAIADALNAAHAVGMPVGIDLDGTLTDHNAWSVVWDRAAERWTVAGYEDAEAGDA